MRENIKNQPTKEQILVEQFNSKAQELYPSLTGKAIITENMVAFKGSDLHLPIKMVGAYINKNNKIESNGSNLYGTVELCDLCEDMLRNMKNNLILTESEKEKIKSIHSRYVNSERPISGDYFTESTHEMMSIMHELGCSKNRAVKIMCEHLGYDQNEFKYLIEEDEQIFDDSEVFTSKSKLQVPLNEK